MIKQQIKPSNHFIILKITKPLIALILTLTTFCSYGRDKTNDNFPTDFKRVQIGINFSPDLCFRTLKDNENSATSNIVMKYNKERLSKWHIRVD
jgi:hypothetical protein